MHFYQCLLLRWLACPGLILLPLARWSGHIYLDENGDKQSQGFLQVRRLCKVDTRGRRHTWHHCIIFGAEPVMRHAPQVRLRDRFTSRELLIATTHLKSKEGAVEERVRLCSA